MSNLSYQNLVDKLTEYKKKYYSNLLLRGVIVSLALLFSAYLFVNTLEYFGRFSPLFRGILFFSFITVLLFSLVYWIINPLLKLFNLNKPISNEEAAVQIGKYFSGVNDKLLNAIQLHTLSKNQNELLLASISQRTQQLSLINFSDAVNYKENNRYIKYVIVPFFILISIFVFAPQFLTESSARIVNFNREYIPSAPFSFNLKNSSLDVFRNEDFTVYLNLNGKAIPQSVFISYNGRKYKMTSSEPGNFSYTFSKIQKPVDFSFEAAGFNSSLYSLNLIQRPGLAHFNAYVSYPAYLNRVDDKLDNVGNLVVPEGSKIKWNFQASEADELLVYFKSNDSTIAADKISDNNFEFSKQATASEAYQVKLKNQFGTNKEDINYYLEVIPDQFPKINVEYFKDTTLFNYIILGGNISDDYGLNRLAVFYKVIKADDAQPDKKFSSFPINIQPKQSIQNFYHQWELNDLNLTPGDKIEYYVQVWDNDGVNGSKSSRSTNFTFQLPTEKELDNDVNELVDQTQGQMNSALNQVTKLKKEITNLENRLKSKKTLDFQDKKLIEDLINKKKELMNEVENLQKQVSELNQKRDRFSEQNSKLAEKVDQLQQLMDELL